MKTYILTGSTPQAITLRPVLAPSGMGGVTVPWANIASVTTHLGSVIVRTNNRRVTYKVNRGSSEEQRQLVEQTFGLTGLATSETRKQENEELIARAKAQLDEAKAAKAEAKAVKPTKEEKAAAKAEAKAAGRARGVEIREKGRADRRRIRDEGRAHRQRMRDDAKAKREARKAAGA